MKDNTPKTVDEILYQLREAMALSSGWVFGRDDVVGKNVQNIAKQQLYQLMMDLIGEKLDDSDGWNYYFSQEARCCPGDDFAHYGNKIKDNQRIKLNELFGVKNG